MSECEHVPYNWNLVYQCRECGEIVPEEIAQPRDIELASLTETIENLRGHLKSKTEDATTEHYDLEKCLKRKFDLLDEHVSLTEKVGAMEQTMDALVERAERVQEGEDWDMAEFVLRKRDALLESE